ncbi:alpha/beta hydrolase [Burkholderiales bacterium]|nr:alpha/beta hydrolase [Burkholderiales bacterium]
MIDVTHHYLKTRDARLHYVTAGSGFPIVLLHGWPQSWYCWRKIIPTLAENFSIIAPDLRGLGDSSRPASGYEKANIAKDIKLLVQEHLEIDQYFLMAHDWGGPVAYVLASENSKHVKKLVMLDTAVPGDGSGTFSQNGRRWHHAFHQTQDLPEALVSGREEIYFGWFYDNYGHQKNAISQEDQLEYLRTYKKPDTLRSGFAYYRALDEDVLYNEELIRLNGKLTMPVLALGGDSTFGRGIETFESLTRVSENVSGGVIQDCGHWIQEEKPAEVMDYVMPFLGSESTTV